MDINTLLENLNPAQRKAVEAPVEHILVLAGAGSGKTRVLVHRVAWLLYTGQARFHNVLALTFTNRAASEMQARVNGLLRTSTPGLWMGTFHGTAHRFLRIHWQLANLPQTFQILDSDDQQRVLKRVLRSLEIDEKVYAIKEVQQFINHRKEHGLRSNDIAVDPGDKWNHYMVSIYRAYEEICQRAGLVDFSELLLRSYETLLNNPPLLEQYQQRFLHILVDEFQDTNTIQYQWLRLLSSKSAKLFVVGDDDQAIYGWRGAKIENIQHFVDDFKAQIIRLEQNYRSTGIILSVANGLIIHNKSRLGKNLWTQDKAGEPVFLYHAYNELDEAHFVASRVQSWPGKKGEIAILYRTSAQSRLFEEALLQYRIPYRIFGGLRFYERAEVKDVLAYLRLMNHRHDDGAFERIVNVPRRGIGDRTVEDIRKTARQYGLSLWQAANHLLDNGALGKRASPTLKTFLALIESLDLSTKDLPLHEQVAKINALSGLVEHYRKESKEEAQRRLENLQELISAARAFADSGKDGVDPRTSFLAQTVLDAGDAEINATQDCVQLMTLHLAKGLEFPCVFLCGLEEGLFPHQNSLDEGTIEEERRLCYVGITRARQVLYLSYSESRFRYGSRDSNPPSRFIREMPVELLQEVRLTLSKPVSIRTTYNFPR